MLGVSNTIHAIALRRRGRVERVLDLGLRRDLTLHPMVSRCCPAASAGSTHPDWSAQETPGGGPLKGSFSEAPHAPRVFGTPMAKTPPHEVARVDVTRARKRDPPNGASAQIDTILLAGMDSSCQPIFGHPLARQRPSPNLPDRQEPEETCRRAMRGFRISVASVRL